MVLGSKVRSILVADAHQDIQNEAVQMVKYNGDSDAFYQAKKNYFNIGGNFSAGVVQGIIPYMPEIRKRLDIS